jgi:putative SOS response-associated peptidase YedK
MCYDISFSTRYELITDYVPGLVIDPQVSIDFDMNLHVMAQAFKKYPVIIFEEGQYKLKPFEWGVIPEYMHTPEQIKKGRSSMCNARSEKIVEDKRSYWHRIRKKRCLIPVTGIFEHREVKGWKNKVPYHLQLKNRPIFCLPGLYHYPNRADMETGEITGTFTLITRPANSLMAQIHNGGDNAFRMPVFLPHELEIKWLLPDLSDEEIAEILNFEMPSEEMNYHPVYTIRTTKERPDQKTKLDAFDWPGLPALGEEPMERTLF